MLTKGLELIIGCMFSGKSTELLKRVRHHKLLGRSVLCITHSCDNRYSSTNDIVTHDKVRHESSLHTTKLSSIDSKTLDEMQVICIEEAQFFPDLYEIVKRWTIDQSFEKIIIVCGLDGDYLANPFIDLLKLIPLADSVSKLSALCMDCCDGTAANFSKRIIPFSSSSSSDDNDEKEYRLLVGDSDIYRSVCRRHFYLN